jgi:hypothetical protein
MNPQEASARRIPDVSPPDPAALAAGLARSLQLSRANALALTRLQLAIRSNDRRAAMTALDRLHALDAEMKRVVDHLPAPAADEPVRPEWDAMARHLDDQKMALSFEKLAMASEISGPDLVSARQPQPLHPPARSEEWPASQTPAEQDDQPPLAECPRLPAVQPVGRKAVPIWLLGLLAAVLAMVALAAAVMAA